MRVGSIGGRVARVVTRGVRRRQRQESWRERRESWRERQQSRGRSSRQTGLRIAYSPTPDGQPDPGEVVWTYVPYEDDPSQGKDRPVLIIGRLGDRLGGLMLSSQDHDIDATDEARYGRYWMDVGSGAWDSSGRPSEVRLDRLIPVDPDQVRREGAALDQAIFDEVVAASRPHLT